MAAGRFDLPGLSAHAQAGRYAATHCDLADQFSGYARLLAQGWTDALRTLHPGKTIYTFWDYFRNAYARNAGIRIDHLLLSPALKDRLVAAEVVRDVRGWEKTSDHAPVWIELDCKPKRARRRSQPPA